MLNQIVVVGRLTKDLELKEEGDKKVATMTLAVPRVEKNSDGTFETDFINFVLWDSIASNVSEYCKKGDIVGVKGRLKTNIIENNDGTKEYELVAVAEKVTFLSSHKSEGED